MKTRTLFIYTCRICRKERSTLKNVRAVIEKCAVCKRREKQQDPNQMEPLGIEEYTTQTSSSNR